MYMKVEAGCGTGWVLGPFVRLFSVVLGFACLGAEPIRVSASEAEEAGKVELARPPGYVGIWIDETGNGAVQLARCGEELCGRIVWLRNPNGGDGAPLTDVLNPIEQERARLVCGMQVVGGLRRQGDGSWDAGWIYDPKDGKRHDVAMRLRASDRLEVTGYLGVKLLSEKLIWKRAGARLPLCVPSAAETRETN